MPAKKKTTKKTTGASRRAEEFKVQGFKLVGTVSKLIQEGNIRKLSIKDKQGKVIMSIPLTVGLIASIAAPVLITLAGVCALVGECTISVERR